MRYGTAPDYTTVFASYKECLDISFKAIAEILLRLGSGYCKANTIPGTHPDSATVFAKPSLCFEI